MHHLPQLKVLLRSVLRVVVHAGWSLDTSQAFLHNSSGFSWFVSSFVVEAQVATLRVRTMCVFVLSPVP